MTESLMEQGFQLALILPNFEKKLQATSIKVDVDREKIASRNAERAATIESNISSTNQKN